mgnify:CR=1 FL=1
MITIARTGLENLDAYVRRFGDNANKAASMTLNDTARWARTRLKSQMQADIRLTESAFTGKPITLETDTVTEQAAKVADHLWKAFAPNIALLPGTYAWQGVADAANGRTDAFGREQSVAQAVVSSVGVKVGSYPPDVLRRNLESRAKAQIAEINDTIQALKRQRQTNRIDQDEFQDAVRKQREKQQKIMRELAEKVG